MSRAATAMRPDLFEATRRSLQREPKELPPVWLYDERGSLLYEAITRLPDYYLPRREAEILARACGVIAAQTRARTLVELGSGSARNTRFLLDALARRALRPLRCQRTRCCGRARDAIAAAYPEVSVEPIVGDFERDLARCPPTARG